MVVLKPSTFLVFAVALNFARAHVAFLGGANHLHAVQGLYVKPSSDGTTGDLYVAATEDKPQWLAENPLNLLTQYASSLPEEAIANQKRAIVTSPQIKYTYAMPMAGGVAANAVSQMLPYPIALSGETTTAAAEGSETTDPAATTATIPAANAAAAAIPYYQHPYYQMYYSQMMSAFANALNAAPKEGSSEEGTNTLATTAPQASAWPYSYPVQYVMVDPSAWAKVQAGVNAPTTSTTETSTAAASNESA
ncbi:hypothetical protein O0L34_g7324 [Tuta absoluta]|nr:hypothetical protein O0L34_g7324 [Tuta absoluta]